MYSYFSILDTNLRVHAVLYLFKLDFEGGFSHFSFPAFLVNKVSSTRNASKEVNSLLNSVKFSLEEDFVLVIRKHEVIVGSGSGQGNWVLRLGFGRAEGKTQKLEIAG